MEFDACEVRASRVVCCLGRIPTGVSGELTPLRAGLVRGTTIRGMPEVPGKYRGTIAAVLRVLAFYQS